MFLATISKFNSRKIFEISFFAKISFQENFIKKFKKCSRKVVLAKIKSLKVVLEFCIFCCCRSIIVASKSWHE